MNTKRGFLWGLKKVLNISCDYIKMYNGDVMGEEKQQKPHQVGRIERSLIKLGSGSGSLAVTLPRGFVMNYGLKAGDKLQLLYDSAILISTPELLKREAIIEEIKEQKEDLLKNEVRPKKHVPKWKMSEQGRKNIGEARKRWWTKRKVEKAAKM